MKLYDTIAIVGVGLIGGSLGLGIKKKGLARKVVGIGHHQKSIRQALRIRAIDSGSLHLKDAKNADLIILAASPKAIIGMLPRLKRLAKKDCVIIDVGSTKSDILRAAAKCRLNFIGCHPLAGLEKKGPGNARSDLFHGSLCLVIPLSAVKKNSLEAVCCFWKALGTRTKIINAAFHDRILSFVSHLPHAVAFCLIDCIDRRYFGFASGGLKDTTRIAASDSLLWSEIFLTNRKQALSALAKFKLSLSRIEALIRKNNPRALQSFLARIKHKRDGL